MKFFKAAICSFVLLCGFSAQAGEAAKMVTQGEGPVISEKEGRRLNDKFLALFNEAIRKNNIHIFYDHIAPGWKKKLTAEKMRSAFDLLFTTKPDFSEAIRNPKTQIKMVRDGTKNWVVSEVMVQGQNFSVAGAYRFEGKKYELVGFRLGFKDPETVVISPEEGAKLNRQAIIVFDKAVKSNDIKIFFDMISPQWKQQITPEELRKIFDPYFTHHIDFSGAINKFPPKADIIVKDGKTRVASEFKVKDGEGKEYTVKLEGIYVMNDGQNQLLGFQFTGE